MSNQPAPQFELLRAAYAAFNARNIDAALALMTPDVAWPRAFKGGFVQGPEEVRAYWTAQWSEINPHVTPVAFHQEDPDHILVDVHQIVRDMAGSVIADERVQHRFTIDHGLIRIMEVFNQAIRSHSPGSQGHDSCSFCGKLPNEYAAIFKKGDVGICNHCLTLTNDIVTSENFERTHSDDSHACSFCSNRQMNSVSLVAGPHVFICNECCKNFYNSFITTNNE
jgi:hypothetical protein